MTPEDYFGGFFMSHAANKVRTLLSNTPHRMTFSQVRKELPELLENEVSMALCYLLRKGFVSREQVPNPINKGRKMVWEYKFLTAQGATNEQAGNQVPQG